MRVLRWARTGTVSEVEGGPGAPQFFDAGDCPSCRLAHADWDVERSGAVAACATSSYWAAIAWVGAMSGHVARTAKARLVAAWIHIVTVEGSTLIAGVEVAAENAGRICSFADHGQMVTQQTLASSSEYGIAKEYTVVVALSWPSFLGFLSLVY